MRELVPDPDRALVVACQQACRAGSMGLEQSFGLLYLRHAEAILRLCRRLTGNASDAHDATQEAFLLAFRRISDFQFRSRFFSWLSCIARRACVEQRRRRPGPRAVSGLDESHADLAVRADPFAIVARREQRRRVRLALRRLSRDHRRILMLRYVEGLSYQEIQERLGIAGGSVKSRLHRAHGDPVWKRDFQQSEGLEPIGRRLIQHHPRTRATVGSI